MGDALKKFLFALMLVMFSFSSASCKDSSKDAPMIARIDAATQSGIAYLSAAYVNKSYQDEYLLYVYPGESIPCPLENGCNITYRLLDAYFDVMFLERAGADMTPLREQADDAHAVLSGLARQWEAERIYNTKNSTAGEGGVALDTYCILGFIKEDRKMAEVARSYLGDDLDWMPDDYYTADLWRNIADESWCSRLFIEVDLDRELSRKLVLKLVNDTGRFIKSENISDSDKLAAVYHTLYVVSDFEKKYEPPSWKKEIYRFLKFITRNRYHNENEYFYLKFHSDKLSYSDFISYYSFKNLAGNTLMTANLLDVMVYSEYDNPPALQELSESILASQDATGMWKMSPGSDPNNVQVFTTFRSLIGLLQYKAYLQR